MMDGDATWGGDHTGLDTGDMLQNCSPEAYTLLLINVSTIYSIKNT